MSERGASPLYETAEDRERERGFFATIEKRFDCDCHKLPIHWQVDCIASRYDDAVCLGEVKHRSHKHDAFPTVIMSRHKLKKGVDIAQFFGIPMICFFRFTDGDYWWKAPLWVKDLNRYREEMWKAKNHAHDPLDAEFVLHIPIEELRAFKKA